MANKKDNRRNELHELYRALGPSAKLDAVASKWTNLKDKDGNEIVGQATCNYCPEVAGKPKTVRNLTRAAGGNAQKHYENKHFDEWFNDVNKLVKEAKAARQVQLQGRLKLKSISGSEGKTTLQKTFNSAKLKADLQWAVNVCAYDLPLSLGEKQGMRDWLDLCRQVPITVNSKYTAPVSKTIRKYLPSIKSSITSNALKYWREALTYYTGPFAAIESDIWKDAVGSNWLGSLVHYISPEGIPHSIFIGLLEIRGSHTADNLVQWQQEVPNGWGLLDSVKGTHFDTIMPGTKLDMKDVFYSGSPDNASNVMAAMKRTAEFVNGCMAHRLNLCLKHSLGGNFITAIDQERAIFGDDHGVHLEDQDKQLELLERIINQDADLDSLNEDSYNSKPIKDLAKNIAARALFLSKSTIAGDKLAIVQEALGEQMLRVITNNKTRWTNFYKMAKRDDLIDPAMSVILDDPVENAPGGLWGDAKGKARKLKCRCPPHMKTMRRQMIAILSPLMEAQVGIQLRFQSLADANELLQICKFALSRETTINVLIKSGTSQETEPYNEDDLLPEMKSMRVRLRELLYEYFPLKPNEEVLTSYYLHCMHKDLTGLFLSAADTSECLSKAKSAVTQRALTILKNDHKLKLRLQDEGCERRSSTTLPPTGTPMQPREEQQEHDTPANNTDPSNNLSILDALEASGCLSDLSPKSKRRRIMESQRSGQCTPSTTTGYRQQDHVTAMKKKIPAEMVIWESLPVEQTRMQTVTVGRGKSTKTKEVEMDPTDQALEYWRERKVQMPTLYMVAMISLSILPTSCRSESIFSLSGNVQSDSRKGSFLGKTFEEICFIKGNRELLPQLDDIVSSMQDGSAESDTPQKEQ